MSVEKTNKLWETQPVGHFKDIRDTSLPHGPIEPSTPLSEVKQEPYNLPAAPCRFHKIVISSLIMYAHKVCLQPSKEQPSWGWWEYV